MCYNKGERVKYWGDINKSIWDIKHHDCFIWCTDNSGQISNGGDRNLEKNIGYCGYSKKTATGNGGNKKKLHYATQSSGH